MDSVETLKKSLKSQCEHAAHWELLLLQGFWYGLLCWLITCAEDEKNPLENRLTAKQIVTLTDPKFESWPTEWLEDSIVNLLSLELTAEELQLLFDDIDSIFSDTIPSNLNIFAILGNGDFISKEQWDALQASIAFLPPHHTSLTNRMKHKTRRSHGKRALTPLRRRRGITHHHRDSKSTKSSEKKNDPAQEQL